MDPGMGKLVTVAAEDMNKKHGIFHIELHCRVIHATIQAKNIPTEAKDVSYN